MHRRAHIRWLSNKKPFEIILSIIIVPPVSEEEKKKLQSQVLESLDADIEGASENLYDSDAKFSSEEED